MATDMHTQPQNYGPNADYPREPNPYKPPRKMSGDSVVWTVITLLIIGIS